MPFVAAKLPVPIVPVIASVKVTVKLINAFVTLAAIESVTVATEGAVVSRTYF